MNFKILSILFIFEVISTISFAQVEKYSVHIEPRFYDQSIVGTTEIILNRPKVNLEFRLYGIKVDSVLAKQKNVPFQVTDSNLQIDLRQFKYKKLSLEIRYHGSPTKGLVWGEGYVYTNYDPCTWMICFEDPGIRARIDISLKIPDGMKAVASGVLKRPGVWQERRAYSSYLYGFAVGNFESLSEKIGKSELQYFGVSQKKEDLKTKFKDTYKIVRFFEEKSGVKLPLKTYTQVLVPGSEAQEKHGFSILGIDFIDPILTDPTEDWAIVHELAHQWWGNLMTCKSWDHFWLNEGLTVFMTAAYKQERWGQAAFNREMELAQKRYQKAIDAKFDVPLTFPGEYPSLALKRAIVYSKGALFLNALRAEMGEEKFWKGLSE